MIHILFQPLENTEGALVWTVVVISFVSWLSDMMLLSVTADIPATTRRALMLFGTMCSVCA